jgi:hypothetical protein
MRTKFWMEILTGRDHSKTQALIEVIIKMDIKELGFGV